MKFYVIICCCFSIKMRIHDSTVVKINEMATSQEEIPTKSFPRLHFLLYNCCHLIHLHYKPQALLIQFNSIKKCLLVSQTEQHSKRFWNPPHQRFNFLSLILRRSIVWKDARSTSTRAPLCSTCTRLTATHWLTDCRCTRSRCRWELWI